ncbi:MAG: HAD-IA family hydrolase, partial [Erysipelotrichaceae bacterium]|nr:HAD-IA family hydrolase [Erysipelotrichaceae bacterium]
PHLVAYNQKQILSEGVPKRPGTDELLAYLKEKGITMAVATSTHRDNALIMLEKAGIGDYFDLVVCGDDVSRSKPNPDIYLKVAEAYPYEKEDMVIFEDAHNGARAAINAGIPLILVPDIAKVTEEDKKEAYLVINSLEEAIDYLY